MAGIYRAQHIARADYDPYRGGTVTAWESYDGRFGRFAQWWRTDLRHENRVVAYMAVDHEGQQYLLDGHPVDGYEREEAE